MKVLIITIIALLLTINVFGQETDILINGVKAGTKTRVAAGAMGRVVADLVNFQKAEEDKKAKEEL